MTRGGRGNPVADNPEHAHAVGGGHVRSGASPAAGNVAEPPASPVGSTALVTRAPLTSPTTSDGAPIYLVVGLTQFSAHFYPVRWRLTIDDALELIYVLYVQAFALDEQLEPYRQRRHAANESYEAVERLRPTWWPLEVSQTDLEVWRAARNSADRELAEAHRRYSADMLDQTWARVAEHQRIGDDFESVHTSSYGPGFEYQIWTIEG